MTTLDDLIARANNVLGTLQGLIEGDAAKTLIPTTSVSYPLPTITFDEANDVWTLAQNTADPADGLYKGEVSLALETACANLEIVSITSHQNPASGAPASWRDCNPSDVFVDESSVSALNGKQLNAFKIRSATPFEVKVKIGWCEDFIEHFTGGLGVRTRFGSGGTLATLPATSPTNGIYDATVGRSSLGSVKAGGYIENPPNHRFTLVGDLGSECTLNNITFWGKSSNGAAPYVVIQIYNAAGNSIGTAQNGFYGGGTNWWFGQFPVNTTHVRYFCIIFEGNQSIDFWIDDIECRVTS
jgi:hypothetical protein